MAVILMTNRVIFNSILLLIVPFLLSGFCFRLPNSKLQEGQEKVVKSIEVSAQHQWVNSGIEISESNKKQIVDMLITSNNLNFCSGEYIDFMVHPGTGERYLDNTELRRGDRVRFNVVGSKVCKNNIDDQEKYIKIEDECEQGWETSFAKILNKRECKDKTCPNKYMLKDAEWLEGKQDAMTEEEGERLGRKKIRDMDQNEYCRMLTQYKSITDTYFLNFMCEKICSTADDKDCVQVELLYRDIRLRKLMRELGSSDSYVKVDELMQKLITEESAVTYIPSLVIEMYGEDFGSNEFNFVRTNYDHKIKQNHDRHEKLTFKFTEKGEGGYNIRATRIVNPENSLYLYVASDGVPKHQPGGSQDIPVDMNKIHDYVYRTELIRRLESKNGKIYFGIRDYGCDYKKNEGNFNITITQKSYHEGVVSWIYEFVNKQFRKFFFGTNDNNNSSIVEKFYNKFLGSGTYSIRSTIRVLLTLYIIMYTLYYFFGLSHVSIYEFLIVCIKMGIITQMLQDNSWNFFYKHLFSLFVDAPTYLLQIVNLKESISPYSEVLRIFDRPLDRILSWEIVGLMISIIFSHLFLGIINFLLISAGIVILIMSIFRAIFSFIANIAIIALLISLAPIFIVCLLFKFTQSMFTQWIGYLARFAIHPILLVLFISLISHTIDYVLYSIFDFEACLGCVLRFDLYFLKMCIMWGLVTERISSIASSMIFLILVCAMQAMLDASTAMSDALFGVYTPAEPAKEYQQSLLGLVGQDEHSRARRDSHGKSRSGQSGSGSGSDGQLQRPQIPIRPTNG